MYITLEEAKKQLNLEEDFTEDDKFIEEVVIPSAEELIAEKLRMKPEELATIRGGEKIPALLRMAMLLAVGLYYDNRSDMVSSKTQKMINGIDEIINQFHEIAL